jgi:hypothetical protein
MVNQLTSLTNEEFNSTLNIKVIAFVVFVIAICIAYLALWMPFVLKMTKDVSLLNQDLTIIIDVAFEVYAKYYPDRSYYKNAKDILVLAQAEFLRDQSQPRRLEVSCERRRPSPPQGSTRSGRL